jgi:hypothetical protein
LNAPDADTRGPLRVRSPRVRRGPRSAWSVGRETPGTWEPLVGPGRQARSAIPTARRDADAEAGVRAAHRTRRREGRAHGEGVARQTEPAQATVTGQGGPGNQGQPSGRGERSRPRRSPNIGSAISMSCATSRFAQSAGGTSARRPPLGWTASGRRTTSAISMRTCTTAWSDSCGSAAEPDASEGGTSRQGRASGAR